MAQPTESKIAQAERRVMPLADLNQAPYNPRTMTDDARAGLATSMREFGYLQAIIWNEKTGLVVGGHRRLEQLQADGYQEAEVVVVNLDPERERLLNVALNNPHIAGDFTQDVVKMVEEFQADTSLEALVGSLRMDELLAEVTAGFDLDPGGAAGGGSEINYTHKIKAPIYEPKGERPPLAALYDRSKSEELVARIDAAGLPDEVAAFLRLAAARHTSFDFSAIAEWYCHADEATQRLMEESALVIIDFDAAIENGFVRLTKYLGTIADLEAVGAIPSDEGEGVGP